MEVTYSPSLYEEKYTKEMSLEVYLENLKKGLKLLEDNKIGNYSDLKELKLIRMALEFNRQMIKENKGKTSIMSSFIAQYQK
jgi:hypothetical protein